MALDVDGFALLKRIAGAPELFPDIRGEAATAARALVVKQLKVRTLPLSGLRLIRDSLGAQDFALVADGLKDAEAKSLVTRLDKNNPEAKTAAPPWLRSRLVDLAGGAEPAAKAAKAAVPKAPKPVAPATVERALGSPAFTATWDGKDHDAPAAKKKKKK